MAWKKERVTVTMLPRTAELPGHISSILRNSSVARRVEACAALVLATFLFLQFILCFLSKTKVKRVSTRSSIFSLWDALAVLWWSIAHRTGRMSNKSWQCYTLLQIS